MRTFLTSLMKQMKQIWRKWRSTSIYMETIITIQWRFHYEEAITNLRSTLPCCLLISLRRHQKWRNLHLITLIAGLNSYRKTNRSLSLSWSHRLRHRQRKMTCIFIELSWLAVNHLTLSSSSNQNPNKKSRTKSSSKTVTWRKWPMNPKNHQNLFNHGNKQGNLYVPTMLTWNL